MGKIVIDKLLKKPLFHIHDPLYLTDSNGSVWQLTINTDGALVTTLTNAPTTGSPMGLLLTLTYNVD